MTQNTNNHNQAKSSDNNENDTGTITLTVTKQDEGEKLSDLQNKHLIKQQKLQSKEEARKEYWKKKRKRERIKKKEKHKQLIQSIKEKGGDPSQLNIRKRRKIEVTNFSEQRVVIDLSWDEYMSDKDIRKLAHQLCYSYGVNFKVERPFQLHFTSFGGRLAKYLETRDDWKHWRVHIHTESYLQLFPKDELVYLTSDSPNEIQTLDSQKVYIIGGLVDHNRLKGITLQKANSEGIATARLPIDQFLVMTARKVLTVNQVLEILLTYTETHDWKDALLSIIPKRKGAQLKENDSSHHVNIQFNNNNNNNNNNNEAKKEEHIIDSSRYTNKDANPNSES